MTWTSLSFVFGQQLTAAQMIQLQDNFAAVANFDSGAPVFDGEGVEAEAISIDTLSTSVGSFSGTLSAESTTDFALAEYCFMPMIYAAFGAINICCNDAAGVGATAQFALRNSQSTGYAYVIQYRYVD